MHTDLRRSIAKRLFEHIDAGTTDRAAAEMTLAERDYLDPARARRERDHVLTDRPVLLAASGELDGPGAFLTTEAGGQPVLLTRQDDAGVRAFRNVCRHRCATVVAAPSGRATAFSCPYHGWTYAGDGSLRVVPDGADSFPALDRAANRLHELRVQERHGLIWLLPADGPGLTEYLGPDVDADLTGLGLAGYAFLRGASFDQPANWKLVMDGFLEVYHVRYLHPKTVGKITISNVFLVDRLGEHLRMASARKDIEKLRPGPGGEQPDILPGIILSYALMPSTVLVYVRDHVEVWTIEPAADPGNCRITLRFLVPTPPATEREHAYWQRNWDTVVGAVHDEDWEAARRIQANLRTDGATMTLGRNELGLHHFHRYLAAHTDADRGVRIETGS